MSIDKRGILIEWLQSGMVKLESDGSISGPLGFRMPATEVRAILGREPSSVSGNHDPGDEDRS